uniref:Chromosome 14 open reading frame 93 n=1 Tax=Latimeria chalumnae TaxID=7897 RepID=H3B649_LATCH
MSFSATILFTPPNSDGKSSCTCKNQQNGSPNRSCNTTNCTPITVCGQGMAVQSTDQLLHLIYQRVEKAVSSAEAALSMAKANNGLLIKLQEEIGEIKSMKVQERDKSCQGGRQEQPTRTADQKDISVPKAVQSENITSLQTGIGELRPFGGALSMPGTLMHFPVNRSPRDLPGQPKFKLWLPPLQNPALEDYNTTIPPIQRVVAPTFNPELSPPSPPVCITGLADSNIENEMEDLSEKSVSPNPATLDSALDPITHGAVMRAFQMPLAPLRPKGTKNARRKRDLVLSKLVHNIHNHVSNDRRFNGSESIKSSWNISVVKFLVEKLKTELLARSHRYTDKELKGACVSYFLTKRREYRNALNPYRSLKEREEKKLRSRRYRLFGNRSFIVKLFSPEDQHLWEGVTEELMSDEEDSLDEPGVWVARTPAFRSQQLTDLCYRIDANSKHGSKSNRVYGPPSERLPSVEVQMMPSHLFNRDFHQQLNDLQILEETVHPNKGFIHEAASSSFIEVKVEDDD